MPGCLRGFWRPHVGSHICVASTLPCELSLQSCPFSQPHCCLSQHNLILKTSSCTDNSSLISRAIPETQKKARVYSYLRVEKPKNKALKWTESEAWDRSKHWVFPLRNWALIQDSADSKSHRARCFLDQLSWVAKSTAFRRQGRENQTQPSVTSSEWLRVSPRKYPAPRQTMGFLNDHSPWELF